jgi:hypothetical protein
MMQLLVGLENPWFGSEATATIFSRRIDINHVLPPPLRRQVTRH